MSSGTFFLVGATHRTASLEIREKLALSVEETAALRDHLSRLEGLSEFTALSTCNRMEFYGVASQPEAIQRLQDAFCSARGFAPTPFEEIKLALCGKEAVRHLLAVASGVDSQMLGETEIFGQVKDAYQLAQEKGHTGPVLNRLFQKTFQAAKHIRTHTAITTGQVSVANVAVELAMSIFGGLDGARILLLGTGDIAEKTARAFLSRGAPSLSVSGRNLERAMELATELGATAIPFDQRDSRLSEFDVVVCSTAAPTAVIDHEAVAAAIRKRPAKPLFLIDLAMPRDVAPESASLQNVFLYDLDDLAKIAEKHRTAREAELAKCRVMLDEKSDALWAQIEARLPATTHRPAEVPQRPAPAG